MHPLRATMHKTTILNVPQNVAEEITAIASRLNARRASVERISVVASGTVVVIYVPAKMDGIPDMDVWKTILAPTGDVEVVLAV